MVTAPRIHHIDKQRSRPGEATHPEVQSVGDPIVPFNERAGHQVLWFDPTFDGEACTCTHIQAAAGRNPDTRIARIKLECPVHFSGSVSHAGTCGSIVRTDDVRGVVFSGPPRDHAGRRTGTRPRRWRGNFHHAAEGSANFIYGNNRGIVPPAVRIWLVWCPNVGVVVIAVVVGFTRIPVRVANRFTTAPDECAFLRVVAQANPKMPVGAAEDAEAVEHPVVLGCVVDGNQMPAQLDRLGFSLRPCAAAQKNVGVTVCAVGDRAGDDLNLTVCRQCRRHDPKNCDHNCSFHKLNSQADMIELLNRRQTENLPAHSSQVGT